MHQTDSLDFEVSNLNIEISKYFLLIFIKYILVFKRLIKTLNFSPEGKIPPPSTLKFERGFTQIRDTFES